MAGARFTDQGESRSRVYGPATHVLHARRRERGAALLLVLWTIAVLALLAGGVSFATRQDTSMANLELDRIRAHWLARAGVERALAEVMDDAVTPNFTDGELDWWIDYPAAMQEVELTGGTVSVMHGGSGRSSYVWFGASDESAKLNINTATREQLMKLPEMTPSIVGAILDWRDRNESPEADGVEGGFYATQAHPYNIRNDTLRTARELLLVRGVTPELFYREDANTNGLLDTNEDDGDRSAPPDNQNGQLEPGWYAYLTPFSYEKNVDAYGEKRLNINDADAATLSQRTGLELWAAESIVRHRQQQRFEHLVDLLRVERSGDSGGDEEAGAFSGLRSDDEKNRPVTTRVLQRIVDSLTLSNDDVVGGRVNINTAPQAVLETLADISPERANAIIQYREGLGDFQSIADLLDVSGITRERFAELENQITVRSSVFRIYSVGTASSGLASATIECVVDRGEEVPRILYWRESSPLRAARRRV